MTTKKARDFLDKELFVNRDVVTFRSLSRELGIHVDDAKNELQVYYDAVQRTDAPAVPTYLISGETPALTFPPRSTTTATQASESAMDVDLEFEEDRGEMDVDAEADVVYQSKVLLVDARVLEEAKAQFSHIRSVHIYSLSPSRLVDPGLVCAPSYKVRAADARGGLESLSVVGKITGPHVKIRTTALGRNAASSSSKTTLDAPVKPAVKSAPKPMVPIKLEQQTAKGGGLFSDTKKQATITTSLPKAESKDRSKPSGKLDWSKAKTKEKEPITEKSRAEKKVKSEPDSPVFATGFAASNRPGLEPTKSSIFKSGAGGMVGGGDAPKRGTKRKSPIDTSLESESDSPPAEAKPSMRAGSSVKKGVVCSDDDDNGEVRRLGQRRPKRKSNVTSDSEMSLRAMMDIDDEQVDRVSRVTKVVPRREEEEEEEEEEKSELEEATLPPATTEDDESDHVPILPKKRKPRKVVPVGRNGLKKRHVVKSRTTTDAKGYMQTEDYSSYESVEEEEEEEMGPKAKSKGKGRETKKASDVTANEDAPKSRALAKEEGSGKVKPKPKPRGGAPKRGGLLNFFGPETGKR